MAMNFWEAQRQARRRTFLLLAIFVAMTLGIAALIEWGLTLYAEETEQPPTHFIGLVFLGVTFAVAGYYYLLYAFHGGDAIAESLGGVRVEADQKDPQLQRLYNVVQEMALASSLPVPHVFVINANEINAFAAGMRPDRSTIGVTRGALERLSRDELQGVIAHEFGHLLSGDSKLNLRLAAMIMGFFIVFYLGIRLLEVAALSRGNGRNTPVLPLIALALFIAGSVTWFFGAILRSMVSRQREYLADACSVQFTRNPQGLAQALRKIQKESLRDMPKRGISFSHMYFSHESLWGRLFATHPSIDKRIAAIEGSAYLTS